MLLLFGLGVFVVTAILLHFLWRPKSVHSLPFPPGPPRDPVIGHLRYMPTKNRATVFHEWAKTYGDVMYLDILGKPTIVLNTARVAVDLLNKRSSIYSDRPRFTSYELTGWSTTLSLMPYGRRFNLHRQLHQSYLNRQKCGEFKPMQTLEARTLQDDKQARALNSFSTSVIAQVVAGHRICSEDDPYMRTTQALMESLGRSGAPGTTRIDLLPFLKYLPSWFPGCESVALVRACNPILRQLYDFPLPTVQAQMETGVARPSFLLTQLNQMRDNTAPVDFEDIRWAAAAMFGSTKVWSSLTVFILAMLLHPEYQCKAQREIDAVIGTSRLPAFEDRDHLPLVESIMQETLRLVASPNRARFEGSRPSKFCVDQWFEPGVPHRLMKDDVYQGMFIPRGSTVFANIRAMSLDESVYSAPESFFPERFLPKPAGKEEPHFSSVYGFGRRFGQFFSLDGIHRVTGARRTCTGRYLGDQSLWIAIASILATCRISNVNDEHGNLIVPDASIIMSEGVSSHPNDFQYIVSPRDPNVPALLDEVDLEAEI
ncbi:cytochrome P450 [Mycena metata]|uniref:Cytochrome P450 n=1 Tax=Mycena metata TaxID=1033252 RepID=A0AAD7NGD0_9AGAR|nr:cytochrome P450 [Mycena metata]